MKKIILIITALTFCRGGFSQINFTDLVNQTEKSVVSIITSDKLGNPLMRGTGFIINEKGVILSNYHLFENAVGATIVLYDNAEFEIDSVISSSKDYDIIKFTIDNPDKLRFNTLIISSKKPLKGEDIFTIGNPMGLESTVSKGIISSIREIPELGSIFQITAPISSGSSGSPVLNMNGEVIGIATFQITGGQNLNFAIDVGVAENIKSNDAILSILASKKVLPTNKELALQVIDSLWSPDTRLPYLNEFIKKYPDDYRGYLKRALLYSINSLSASLFIESRYRSQDDSLYSLGISKVYSKSIPDYDKAILLSPNEPMIYYYRGGSKYFYCKENSNKITGWTFQSAIDDLLKCKNLTEKLLQQKRLYYLGLCYLEISKFKEALISYNNAIDVRNVPFDSLYNSYLIYFDRAKVKYNHFNDTIGALQDLDKAIELSKTIYYFRDENNAPSKLLAKRATIRLDTKDYQGALDDLRKANKSIYFSKDGRSDYTHYLECYLIRILDGDMSDALTSINQAIIQYDNISSYYRERSRVNFELKEYSNALVDLNKSFELNPKSIDALAYSDRAKIKALLNDNLGAIKDLDSAIKLDIKNDSYYFLKGITLNRLGDDYGAILQYDKAIEIDSKNPNYYFERGWAKLKNNKTGACADWSKAGEMGKYEAYDLIQKYCK